MSCLIQLSLYLCLIQPSDFTVRADVSRHVAGESAVWINGWNYGSGRIGRLQAEVPLVEYRGFTLLGGVEHTSLIDSADRGQERFYIGMQWRPFRN